MSYALVEQDGEYILVRSNRDGGQSFIPLVTDNADYIEYKRLVANGEQEDLQCEQHERSNLIDALGDIL